MGTTQFMNGKSASAGRDVVIVHTSDVHVDHEYTARMFDGDGTGSLKIVLGAARKVNADVVLLCGDTFDNHRLPGALLEETGRTLASAGMHVVILPGNHDPVVEDAVFHHAAFSGLDNVTILGLTHDEAVGFPELDLEVWGRAHRHYGDMDPLEFIRPRSTRWQVAMAHGHYEPRPDRSTRLRPSWLLGDSEIGATGADYLALGHWNRPVQVGPGDVAAYYSGSPDYARTVNVVRLAANGRIEVTREPLELPAHLLAESY